MWSGLPTAVLVAAFSAASAVIFFSGMKMTGLADRLADRTSLGEAIIGGVLLGAATSLGGIIVSVTASLDGRASLAFSNSVGGIAAQTPFPRSHGLSLPIRPTSTSKRCSCGYDATREALALQTPLGFFKAFCPRG